MMIRTMTAVALIGALAMEAGAQDRSDAVARLTQSVEGLKAQNVDLRAQVDRLTASLDGMVKENGRLRESMGRIEARLSGSRRSGASGTDVGAPIGGLRSKPWLDDLKAMEQRIGARLSVLEARIDALYGRKPTPSGAPSTDRARPQRGGDGDAGAGRARPDARPRSPKAKGTDRERGDARAKRAGDEKQRKDVRAKRPKTGGAETRRDKRP